MASLSKAELIKKQVAIVFNKESSKPLLSVMQTSLEQLRAELPSMYNVTSRMSLQHCLTCGKTEQYLEGKRTLMLCAGCRVVRYCSVKCQKLDYANHKLGCQTDATFRQKLNGDSLHKVLIRDLEKWAELQLANLIFCSYHGLNMYREPQKASKLAIRYSVKRTSSDDPAFFFTLHDYQIFPVHEIIFGVGQKLASVTKQMGEAPVTLSFYQIVVLVDGKQSQVGKEYPVSLRQKNIDDGLPSCANTREEEKDWFSKYQLLVNSGKTCHPPLDQSEDENNGPDASSHKFASTASATAAPKRKKKIAKKPPFAASMQGKAQQDAAL